MASGVEFALGPEEDLLVAGLSSKIDELGHDLCDQSLEPLVVAVLLPVKLTMPLNDPAHVSGPVLANDVGVRVGINLSPRWGLVFFFAHPRLTPWAAFFRRLRGWCENRSISLRRA